MEDKKENKTEDKKEFSYSQFLNDGGFADAKDKIDFVDKIIFQKLNDKEYVEKCREKDLKIDRGKDHFFDQEKMQCQNNPFEMKEGSTISVVNTINKGEKISEGEIAVEIFADQTYCGCGIFLGWTTQEEATLRDSNPELFAYLLGNEYIINKLSIKADELKLEYNRAHKNPLSTSDGYIIKGEVNVLNNKEILNEPISVYFLFTSMPSLSGKSTNFDPNGTVSWTMKCRKIFNKECKEEALYKLIKIFYQRRREKKLGFNSSAMFKRAMMLLMFSDKVELPKNPSEEEINKTIDQLTVFVKDDRKENLPEFLEAKKNYENTIRQSIRAWIIMARKKGVKYYIGGPVGCGVFENEVDVVSRIIAEEFVQYGGKMKFIYAAFHGANDKSYPIFAKAFETAYNNLKNQ